MTTFPRGESVKFVVWIYPIMRTWLNGDHSNSPRLLPHEERHVKFNRAIVVKEGTQRMANPEHLNILKQGVETWNQWREEHPEIEPDLQEANLVGTHLEG